MNKALWSAYILYSSCHPDFLNESVIDVIDCLFIASEGVTFLFPVLPTDQLTPTWPDVFALAFYRPLG